MQGHLLRYKDSAGLALLHMSQLGPSKHVYGSTGEIGGSGGGGGGESKSGSGSGSGSDTNVNSSSTMPQSQAGEEGTEKEMKGSVIDATTTPTTIKTQRKYRVARSMTVEQIDKMYFNPQEGWDTDVKEIGTK